MVHYAGHSKMSVHEELLFVANSKNQRSFDLQRTLLSPVLRLETESHEENPQVDVVYILDACFSGRVTRAAAGASRIVEVLAAVDAEDEALGNNPSRPKIQNRTFTSKLATEISIAKGRGPPIELAEIIASI